MSEDPLVVVRVTAPSCVKTPEAARRNSAKVEAAITEGEPEFPPIEPASPLPWGGAGGTLWDAKHETVFSSDIDNARAQSDLAFIKAACNAYPKMRAALAAKDAEIARLRATIDRVKAMRDGGLREHHQFVKAINDALFSGDMIGLPLARTDS